MTKEQQNTINNLLDFLQSQGKISSDIFISYDTTKKLIDTKKIGLMSIKTKQFISSIFTINKMIELLSYQLLETNERFFILNTLEQKK